MEKDARDSAGVCKQLEKEYPWISSEKRLFGRPGSDYDWTARDPQAAFAEYRQLEETLQGLSETLNKKVRKLPSHWTLVCTSPFAHSVCWRTCPKHPVSGRAGGLHQDTSIPGVHLM